MQIYDNRNDTSELRCSYCRQTGHNISKCPHVQPDWESWSKHIVPLRDPDCWVHSAKTPHGRKHWYFYPRYWSDWYSNAETGYRKQQQAKARGESPRQRRGPRKCGFCGEEGHSRRNCDKLVAFRQRANKANQAIRRYVYNRLVVDHGIDVGALIEPEILKYDYSTDSYVMKSFGVCTVTSVSWDTVSITSDYTSRGYAKTLDWDLRTPIYVRFVKPDGTAGSVTIHLDRDVIPGEMSVSERLTKNSRETIRQVISPSPTPLDEQWVQDGRQETYDWLSSKRSLSWLQKKGIIYRVDKWTDRYEEATDVSEQQ